MKVNIKFLMKLLFGVYVLFLLYLLFLKGIRIRDSRINAIQDFGFWGAVRNCMNLVPFRTIASYANRLEQFSIRDFAFQNLAGNVLLFLPWGVFAPYFWEKQRKFLKFFIISVLMIFCVEVIQILTFLGSFDVDDLLLNIIGCCIGFGCFYLIKPILQKINT